MKRSPIARGSSKLKRTRLRPIGKRARATRHAIDQVRNAVLKRDKYVCARCRYPNCLPLELHHRRARSQGGEHTLANLVTLGRRCHAAVTDHTAPDWRKWITTKFQTKKGL